MQALIDFLAIKDLIPHGYCLNWNPLLLWLHVASDILIALSYYSIPLSLAYFVRQRKDSPYPWLIFAFGLFILACGTTHFLSAIMIWLPLYWLDGYVKAFTAIVSVIAAVLMFRIIPKALQLPSAAQLQAEIDRRIVVEEALRLSETKFRTLYNSTSDALMLLNEQGFFDCNPATLSMFGCTDKRVMLSKYPADFSPAKQACGADSMTLANYYITRTLATGSQRFEWIHKRVDTDTVFPVEVLLNTMDINGKWTIQCVVRDISERKQAEQRLKQSEAQFRTLIESLRVGITLQNAQTEIVLHNPHALELLGMSSGQLLGRTAFDSYWDILHEDGSPFLGDTLPVPQAIATRLSVQNVVMSVFRPVNKDRVWLLVTATPQLDDDGSVLQVICSFNDISRRKEAEQRLEQSEAHFRNTFEHAPIGVATLSLKGRFLAVNRTCCDMLAYDQSELLTMSFIPLIQVRDRAFHLRYIRQLLSGGILSFSVVKQYVRKDNSRVWGSLSVRLIRHVDGSPDYIVATLEDIDERKRVENDMITTRNKLQATLNAIPDVLFELGLNGCCYDVYTARNDLLNRPIEQLIGKNVADFLSQEATLVILSALHEAKDKGYSHGKQLLLTHPQSDLWIELSVAAKQGVNDQPHFIVLWLDITKRKLAELQLRENEERLNLSQEYGGIGSWEHDLSNHQQVWSPTTFQLSGLPYKAHPTWEDFLAIVYPDDRQLLLKAHQAHLSQGEKYDVEYRIVSTHGQHRWMRSVGRAEFATDGTPTRFIGIVQDITERKHMEAELKRSNADLEQFAYAISHDMRQPLRMVSSYLTLIETAIAQQLNEEQQQFLNFAIEGAKRMDAMILSLLDYSRVGHKTAAITRVASRTALNEALAFLEPERLASGGSIAVYGDWSEIMINPDELTRLLQNLIGNALKYHEENKPPLVEICALTTANSFKVSVRDNGIGIDNNQFERLFKVFSRLQARSRFEGTGVGLALCRKIVEYYGGNIGVESAGDGLGSVFWFELPLSQPVSTESKS
jgi:PAS domain S-box-containing protein